MCCLLLAMFLVGPRFALLLWWIFGEKVEAAFDSWYWPLLGLILFPWTTLMYVIAWAPGGINGFWDYLLITLGVLLDIGTYVARAAGQRTGTWQ